MGEVNQSTRLRHFGKTLNNISGLNYREAYNLLRRVIGTEAGQFRFLAESDKLDDGDRRMFETGVSR